MNIYQMIEAYIEIEKNKPEFAQANYAARNFAERKNIKKEEEIPEPIVNLIAKIHDEAVLSEEDIAAFHNELIALEKNPNLRAAVIGIFHRVVLQVFNKYQEEIKKDKNDILDAIQNGHPLPSEPTPNLEKYKGLLNLYLVTRGNFLETNQSGLDFPNLTEAIQAQFQYDIPFAINVLVLKNKLPQDTHYCGFDLSKPIYPEKIKVVKEGERIPITRGIQKSEAFRPISYINKIAKGDTGDNTFIAVNEKKVLYIRGVERYVPSAILASKIATFISKDHFSSERLLDNRLAGARKLPGYKDSVYSSNGRIIRSAARVQHKVIPGSGTIDEVTNFVNEADRNIENFGFSKAAEKRNLDGVVAYDLDGIFVSKIDFDGCSVSSELSKDKYEQDILLTDFYEGSDYVRTNDTYITEKLQTRLKLSIMSKEFLTELSKKAYIDQQEGRAAVTELASRTEIALSLFLESKDLEKFMVKHPYIFSQIRNESIEYIKKHFDDDQQQAIIESMNARIEMVKGEVAKRLPNIIFTESAPVSKNSDISKERIIHLLEALERDKGLNESKKGQISEIRQSFANNNNNSNEAFLQTIRRVEQCIAKEKSTTPKQKASFFSLFKKSSKQQTLLTQKIGKNSLKELLAIKSQLLKTETKLMPASPSFH